MPELHTFASPAVYTMLALCALSMGFMLRALFAFAAETRKEPAKHFVRIAPAPGRAGPVCEQVFDDVPVAFAVRYSFQFNWSHAAADSTRSRSV
jgi:hypothetical protein